MRDGIDQRNATNQSRVERPSFFEPTSTSSPRSRLAILNEGRGKENVNPNTNAAVSRVTSLRVNEANIDL